MTFKKLSITLFLLALSLKAEASCLKAYFRIVDETVSPVYFNVKKNAHCIINLSGHPIDAYYGVKITQSAKYGKAGTQGITSFAYKAQNDFVGNDKFRVRVEYEKYGKRMKGELEVYVTVYE